MQPPQIQSVLPERRVERLTRPFVRFLHIEAASGAVLIVCALLALLAANSDFAQAYQAVWDQTFRIGVGGFELAYPLWYWVNDGLMAIFFFVIGLEIKRELVHGELSDPRKVVLPIAAALGGAAIPALIYAALQRGEPGSAGWAIPMATDIAFVVGCMALLGSRIPHGLKILMLSLAIVDDILAVLVIALFYSEPLDPGWLAGAAAGFGLIAAANRSGVRTVGIYVAIGAAIWLCTLKSGIHPTIAGVLLGLLTPASAWIGDRSLAQVLRLGGRALSARRHSAEPEARRETLERLHFAAREAISPLERLEVALHPWVGFAIMPLFALANAAVAIQFSVVSDPVALAVVAGLVLGKPVGIGFASLLVIRLGWARLPAGVTAVGVLGAGVLAGIGFTMSLFVASLAFPAGPQLAAAKAGILLGSAISASVGMGLLAWSFPARPDSPEARG